MLKKTVAGGLLTLGALIVGFFFLIRSCLSRYDERHAVSTPLTFEKDGKTILFSIVKFDKTMSYSRSGGFVRKSVSTSYSVQTNDAATGAVIAEKKLKNSRKIKSYPVEIMGATTNAAWIFLGEPMAIDPFTFTIIADLKALEEKNPALKGKLSTDRKYYAFDPADNSLLITANDGIAYRLNTTTLQAMATDEDSNADPAEARLKYLDKLLEKNRKENDLNYERFRANNRLYSERKLSPAAYKDSSIFFEKERGRLSQLRDSLDALQREARDQQMNNSTQKSMRESFLRGSTSFSSIKVNCDTLQGRWYGLYTNEELEKLWERFDYRTTHGDAARNKFFTASLAVKNPGRKPAEWIIGEEKTKTGNGVYLQGGFLLDKFTALPVRLSNPDGWLVVYKDKIGNEGQIMVTRLDKNGKETWTITSGLKDFFHWEIQGNRLILTGVDNKELSSSEPNVLHIADLTSGQMISYDFFTNKVRK